MTGAWGVSAPAAAAGALAVMLGAVTGLALPHGWQAAASALLAGTTGAIAAEDWRTYRIPDVLSLSAALAGLAMAWIGAPWIEVEPLSALLQAIVSALLCGGALFLLRELHFRLRGVDGLGFGDVKLAAAGGIWLGWSLFPFAVLAASLGSLLFVGATHLLEGGWRRDRRLPFAVTLAPAIWLTWFVSERLGLQ